MKLKYIIAAALVPEWASSAINTGEGGPATRSYQIGVNLKF